MFRKRLDRAGFNGVIVVGGIEVGWQEKVRIVRLRTEPFQSSPRAAGLACT